MSKKTSILFSILLLVIGFATITTTLVLNGAVELASNNEDFKIIFTSVKLNNRKRNDFISADKQIINFESDKLTDIDDEAVIDYEVTNTSKMYDGEVTINCIVPNNEYVDIEYQPKNMIITSGKTKSGSITARLIKLSTSEEDINIKCTLDANALERETIGEDYIPPFSKSGVLMAYEENEKFWKFRSNITRVEFENELISHDTNDELIFDVSVGQDGSVMAYLVENGEELTNSNLDNKTAYTLYIQSNSGVIGNPNSFNLFHSFINLIEITNFQYFDTSQVVNMSSMFYNCINLKNLDLSNFETTSVTNMSNMFEKCNSIEIIDISNFDTSNVINMNSIFSSGNAYSATNRSLKEIKGLENFNTAKVTNMGGMFNGVTNIKSLDLSNFDVSNVTSMANMFAHCKDLITINISGWNTSVNTNFHALFWECQKLQEIKGIEELNVSKVIYFSNMFTSCSSIDKLDLSKWNTGSGKTFYAMFAGVYRLKYLNISNFDTSNAVDLRAMFEGCTNLIELDVSNFNISKTIQMAGMFKNCQSLTSLDVSLWDTSKVNTMENIFSGCNNLSSLDVSRWNTENVVNFSGMFYQCNSLKNIDVSNFNTSKATNMSMMFAYCENLENLDVSKWITTNVTDMSGMFGYLRKIKDLNVANFDTSNVTTMRAMFVECNVLDSLDLNNFDLTNVINLNSFVAGCHVLKTTITIRGTKCTNFAGENGYWSIFFNSATNGNIVVNYTADASDLVDQMIATKSEDSRVYKGIEII